jgi:Zn-dependent M16 (insulinase) family peptidase
MGWCSGGLSLSSGALAFYSYRDPSVGSTLQAYDATADWVLSGNFSDRDIDEAKVWSLPLAQIV